MKTKEQYWPFSGEFTLFNGKLIGYEGPGRGDRVLSKITYQKDEFPDKFFHRVMIVLVLILEHKGHPLKNFKLR